MELNLNQNDVEKALRNFAQETMPSFDRRQFGEISWKNSRGESGITVTIDINPIVPDDVEAPHYPLLDEAKVAPQPTQTDEVVTLEKNLVEPMTTVRKTRGSLRDTFRQKEEAPVEDKQETLPFDTEDKEEETKAPAASVNPFLR